MILRPTKEALELFHRGALVFADMEQNGIRIDRARLERNIERTKKKIRRQEEELRQDEIWKVWKRRFGYKANLGSKQQLPEIIFKVLKYEKGNAAKGRNAKEKEGSEAAFAHLNIPFLKLYFDTERLKKALGTYLMGIQKELSGDNILRAFFDLNTATTYRGNSSNPNFQNWPIRNKTIGKLIREVFIPREGHVLVEVDISSAEVRVSACYNKDPRLIEYIKDKTKDMHRDMAAQCYACNTSQVTKEMRYGGKNKFVFPQFYGAWYDPCATALWDWAAGLKIDQTTPLRDWLKLHGFRNLERFKEHIKKVEDHFWNRRFKVYNEWKQEWWERYLKTGQFQLLSGFVCSGIYVKNDVINYPVQGAAFHCLLWGLVRLHRTLKRRKMRALLIGQIHDSILADVPIEEVDEYIAIAKKSIEVDLLQAWDWLIVPMETEVEVARTNWFEKEEYKV